MFKVPQKIYLFHLLILNTNAFMHTYAHYSHPKSLFLQVMDKLCLIWASVQVGQFFSTYTQNSM